MTTTGSAAPQERRIGAPAPPRGGLGMSARGLISFTTCGLVQVVVYESLRHLVPTLSTRAAIPLSVLVACPLVFLIARRFIHRSVTDVIVAVSDGLLSLTENDYAIRLVMDRSDEAGMLVYRFNTLTERLRREHNDVYQREMLLETVLGATSMIVVICNEALRVVYANAAAKQFFGCGSGRPEGRNLEELLGGAPPEVQQAARAPTDVLFTWDRPGGDQETFHLSKRYFELSARKHTLFLLRPLTKELARKEVETWKKAIRVMSHEVNNSLAPISSLLHSARLMMGNPAHGQRLGAALDTIEERAAHLKTFLDGYSSFARLPAPKKQMVRWKDLLRGVEGLYPFVVSGTVPERPAHVDPAQLQQVLINLLKNAVESGSPPDQVTISFLADGKEGVEFAVVDRGKGMSDEVLKNALLPFYSTKKSGTGLGLALCREIVEAHGGRLSLHHRDGGGVSVRCWLPAAEA
jgi:nitrogen fixation/metabolism regulation signal transduction histidine kinase